MQRMWAEVAALCERNRDAILGWLIFGACLVLVFGFVYACVNFG